MLPALTQETLVSLPAAPRAADEAGAAARAARSEPFRSVLARLGAGQEADHPAEPAPDRDAGDDLSAEAGAESEEEARAEAGGEAAIEATGGTGVDAPSSEGAPAPRPSGYEDFLALPETATATPPAPAPEAARARPSPEAAIEGRFGLRTGMAAGLSEARSDLRSGAAFAARGATSPSPTGPGNDPRESGISRPETAWTLPAGEPALPGAGLPAGAPLAPGGIAAEGLAMPPAKTASRTMDGALSAPGAVAGSTLTAVAFAAGGEGLASGPDRDPAGRAEIAPAGSGAERSGGVPTGPGIAAPQPLASGSPERAAGQKATPGATAPSRGEGAAPSLPGMRLTLDAPAPRAAVASMTGAPLAPTLALGTAAAPGSGYRAAQELTAPPPSPPGALLEQVPARAAAAVPAGATNAPRESAAQAPGVGYLAARKLAAPLPTGSAGVVTPPPASATPRDSAAPDLRTAARPAGNPAGLDGARAGTDALSPASRPAAARPGTEALAEPLPDSGAGAELRTETLSRPEAASDPRSSTPAAAQSAQRIAQQIGTALQAPEPAAGGGFELALEPAELGQVRLKLVSLDSASLLIVQAERPETLDLMRRHIGSLEQELRQLGHENLTLRFAGGEAGRQGAQGGEAPPRPSVEPAETRTGAVVASDPLSPRRIARDHLDLRL